MAVRVRRVVIPIPTLPGTDSGGMKRESQARTWKKMMKRMMSRKMILTTKTVEGIYVCTIRYPICLVRWSWNRIGAELIIMIHSQY